MPKPKLPKKLFGPFKHLSSKKKVGKDTFHLIDEGLVIPSHLKAGESIKKASARAGRMMKKPTASFKWFREHRGEILGKEVPPTRLGRYLKGKEVRSTVASPVRRGIPLTKEPPLSSQMETFAPVMKKKKVRVHPRTKLSNAQMQEVMKRALKKQPGKGTAWEKIQANPKLQSALMEREPPTESWYGRFRNKPPGGMPTGPETPKPPMRMEPLQDARLRYLKDPKHTVPTSGGGSFKSLRQASPGTPGEIAPGVVYEKAKLGSILPPSVQRVLTNELPKVKEAQRVAASTLATDAYEGGLVWKEVVGGMRSTLGKMWKMRFEGSRYRRAYSSAQDYFIAQYTKWKKQPGKFAKNFPSEAQFFKQISPEVAEKLGGG